MKLITKSLKLYINLIIIISLLPLWGFTFVNINNSTSCVTYFSNLTNGDEIKKRDICYTIKFEEYTSFNERYRFTVTIVDNEKNRTINLSNLIFSKRYDGSTTNYHVDESYDFTTSNIKIKSLIYYRNQKKWCILFKENDEFKFLSFYEGYQFIDEFGVGKSKRSNSLEAF